MDDIQRALDPTTTAADLQRLAAVNPQVRALVALHPHAYPDLLTWLGSLRDPEVDAALAHRSAGGRATPPPSTMPPPGATTQPRPLAESAGHRAGRRPRWVVPVVITAVLALGGTAAAVVIPRLGGDVDPDAGSGAAPSGTSEQSGSADQSGSAEQAGTTAGDVPPSFDDGARVAWERTASQIMGEQAQFGWRPAQEYNGEASNWGPMVFGDVVVSTMDLGVDGGAGDALVGIDGTSGELLWRLDRGLGCEPWGPGHLACSEWDAPARELLRIDAATGAIVSATSTGLPGDGMTWLTVQRGLAVLETTDDERETFTVTAVATDGSLERQVSVSGLGMDGPTAQLGKDLTLVQVFLPGYSSQGGSAVDRSGAVVHGGLSWVTLTPDDHLITPASDPQSGITAAPRGTTWLNVVEGASAWMLLSASSAGSGTGEYLMVDPGSGSGLPLSDSPASVTWVEIDGVERLVVHADDGQLSTHDAAGAVVSETTTSAENERAMVAGSTLVTGPTPYDDELGVPLQGWSIATGERLWSLDVGQDALKAAGPGVVVLADIVTANDWPVRSISGVVPAESSETPVVAQASTIDGIHVDLADDVPACPGDTILLAWAQLSDGWVIVCGYTLAEPTYWAMRTAGVTTSGGTGSLVESDTVAWDDVEGRYTATLADGSTAWLEHTPAVVGVRASTGATAIQRSAVTVIFVQLGLGGAAIGTGAYDVAAPEQTPEDQVRYFNEILRRSEGARAALSPAVVTVRDCLALGGDYSAEIAVITAVRDNRAELRAAIQAAPVDLVPEGTALVDELTAALTASYEADVDYLAWAQAVQAAGCGAGDESPATEHSRVAGEWKEAFAARWNAVIAPTFAVPTVSRENL